METYLISRTYSVTTEQTFERRTGRLISDVHSIRTLIKVEPQILTEIYSSVSPAESKEIAYN
jgi:helix-turn-helix protein